MVHLAPDWRDRYSLSGRKALVTGASKRIGAMICEVFAQAGANIVAVGRDEAVPAEWHAPSARPW